MKKEWVWLSFDLGVKGDYEGLYPFLDSWKARECGQSVAAFIFQFKDDLLNELKTAIEEAVELDSRSRIYVVRTVRKEDSTRTAGRFLIGSRKAAPWAGYATTDEGTKDEG